MLQLSGPSALRVHVNQLTYIYIHVPLPCHLMHTYILLQCIIQCDNALCTCVLYCPNVILMN